MKTCAYFVLFVMVMGLTSCTSVTLVQSDLMIAPTAEIARVATPIPTATPLPPPPAIPVCPPPNADIERPQLGLNGILPGVTRKDELSSLAGEPSDVSVLDVVQSEYIYENFAVTPERSIRVNISTVNDTVAIVLTRGWVGTNPIKGNDPTVADVIETFGCPDFIYLDWFGEHPPADGSYNRGRLVYRDAGVEFDFDRLPLRLNSRTTYTLFFDPYSDNFITERYQDLGIDQIVTWEEAAQSPQP